LKFLIWALVIYLAWRWYEMKKLKASGAVPSAVATEDATETMVACAQCGIHLPVSAAVRSAGSQYFCCDAHRADHSQH
jgi:uncharacterized protein